MSQDDLILAVKGKRLLRHQGVKYTVEPEMFLPSSFDVGKFHALLSSRWTCTVSRPSKKVSVTLKMLNFQQWCIYPEYQFVHFVPSSSTTLYYKAFDITSNTSPTKGGTFTFSRKPGALSDIMDGNMYAFKLVLSTSKSQPMAAQVNGALTLSHMSSRTNPPIPPRVPPIPVQVPPIPARAPLIPEKPSVSKSFKEMFPDLHQNMLRLLKDPGSVSVAFVFTIHSCERKVALWAHRTLLDKYLRFQELFDVADGNPTLVPIDGISLTTFCVLLKHAYTEDLDLNVDPTQFLMCDMDHLKDEASMDSISRLGVLNESLKEYNAAQFYATWNVKDKVTWSDLFLAADRFGMTKLRKQCLGNLLASVDDNNAMEIIFGVGMCFKEDIRDPVMKYIANRLANGFSLKTQDPFKRFADHEACHEVMLELLRLTHSK